LRFSAKSRPRRPLGPAEQTPWPQLDDVHSVLRLNYETPEGLISLAPPGFAKPTLCETAFPIPVQHRGGWSWEAFADKQYNRPVLRRASRSYIQQSIRRHYRGTVSLVLCTMGKATTGFSSGNDSGKR
jgi:hypothetical protein